MKLFLALSLILLALTSTARAASGSSSSDLSEWQHQASIGAIEFTPFYISNSESATFNSASSVTAEKMTGANYGLSVEYGWLQSMTLGVRLLFENELLKTTDSGNALQVQTNGLFGVSLYTRGNADISFSTLTYGLEFTSLSSSQIFTASGVSGTQAGYVISPYLGFEFKLNGAVTGLKFQYNIMENEIITNELASPTTTQSVTGGNQVKASLYYEENWSWLKLGIAGSYLTSAATSDKTTSVTDNDQSTTLEGTFYFPIYLSDSFTILPAVDYATQSFASSLSSVKSRTDLSLSFGLRMAF